jgi:transporter family protein
MQHPWLPYALASAGFAALTAIFAKLGVVSLNPNLATFIRTVVVLVVTALLVTCRQEWSWPAGAEGRALRPLVFLGLSGIATGLSWLCYFQALKLGPASKVAPIDKLSVVFVVILAALFLGEVVDAKTAIGVGLIAAGAVVLAI